MAENKNEIVLKRVEEAIRNIDEKTCKLYFFVSDCKNIPNSNSLYIYNIAATLKEKGYNVCMLYQLNNEYTQHELKKLHKLNKPIDELRVFEGISKWLPMERYTSLQHLNIANGTWSVSPSDFLFIPEVFSSLMKETFDKHLPCKRFVILQNFRYVTEFIPYGDQWASYGITDAIASSEQQSELIRSVFPYVHCEILSPYFSEPLTKPKKAKKLIVNIASPKNSDIEFIIKTFYWKYPTMQFVTFRTLRNLPFNEYAEMLKEGCITIWHDPMSSFGYSALDAMKCGNIVIGKVPDVIPQWMRKGDSLKDNGIWYDNINDVADILAKVVGTWMRDEVPSEIYEAMEDTTEQFGFKKWDNTIEELFANILNNRKKEFEQFKHAVENNMKKANEA